MSRVPEYYLRYTGIRRALWVSIFILVLRVSLLRKDEHRIHVFYSILWGSLSPKHVSRTGLLRPYLFFKWTLNTVVPILFDFLQAFYKQCLYHNYLESFLRKVHVKKINIVHISCVENSILKIVKYEII